MARKIWTHNRKRYWYWCWTGLGTSTGLFLLTALGAIPTLDFDFVAAPLFVGVFGGMLVSYRRVVVGDTEEDLRRFEDEQLRDPWIDSSEATGIKLRRWWRSR